MNGNIPKEVRHGAGPLQTSRYSEEFIANQNREHDLKYGFSQEHPTLYTNADRLPETFRGSIKDIWKQTKP